MLVYILAILCNKSKDLKYGLCNTVVRETQNTSLYQNHPNSVRADSRATLTLLKDELKSVSVSMLHPLLPPSVLISERHTSPFIHFQTFQQVCMALWFHYCARDLFCYTVCSNYVKSKNFKTPNSTVSLELISST